MKKTFSLLHPKVNIDRRVEAIKHEIKKYQARERKKALPESADFWGFDCKFGLNEADTEEIHVAQINKKIDEVHAQSLTFFYLEIIAVAQQRTHKPAQQSSENIDTAAAEDDPGQNNGE